MTRLLTRHVLVGLALVALLSAACNVPPSGLNAPSGAPPTRAEIAAVLPEVVGELRELGVASVSPTATTGSAFPVHERKSRIRSDEPLTQMAWTYPSRYLFTVVSDTRVVGSFELRREQGGGWGIGTVSEGSRNYSSFAAAERLCRDRLGRHAETRAVIGSAVLARAGTTEGAVFLTDGCGSAAAGPDIRGGVLYLGEDARERILWAWRDALPEYTGQSGARAK